MKNNILFGEPFSIYFKFVDKIFKKNDAFEAHITDSTGKSIKFKSIYPDKPEYKYNELNIPDSAGTIILDILIKRADNGDLIAKGNVTIKYDDILRELIITPINFKDKKKGVLITLKKDAKENTYFTFEISRGDNGSVAG